MITGYQGRVWGVKSRMIVLVALHVAVYAALIVVLGIPAVWGVALAGLLIWASVEDVQTFELPDTASGLLVVSGLAWSWTAPGINPATQLVGVVVWPIAFWCVAAGFRQLRGYDGLGFGDVKLIGGIAAWTGLSDTIWVVLAAAIAGIVTLLTLSVIRGAKPSDLTVGAVAFGPFLCLSAWGVWLAGGIA